MVIVVYTSGISGNKEVKKRQQRIFMILESKSVKYRTIDITEPGREQDKQFMQEHSEAKGLKHPLPPQIFNEDDYCGDYDGFDLANENDELEIFLKMPLPPPPAVNGEPKLKEDASSDLPKFDRNEEIMGLMVPENPSSLNGNGSLIPQQKDFELSSVPHEINEMDADIIIEKPKEVDYEGGEDEEDEDEEMEDDEIQENDSSMKENDPDQGAKNSENEDGAEGEE